MAQITIYEPSQPLIAGQEYVFPAFLFQTLNSQFIQINPTISIGDVKISKDGGGYVNISTLPSEVGSSGELTVSLSSLETTGVTKYITIKFSDVSGSQWCDAIYQIDVQESNIINLDNLDVAVSTRLSDSDARLNALDTTISSRSTLTSNEVWSNTVRTLTSGGSSSGATAGEIWEYPIRTITDASGLASGIWEYENRTLTGWRQLVIDIWNAIPSWLSKRLEQYVNADYFLYKGVTNEISIISNVELMGASNIVFSIKNNASDPDSKSIIRIESLNGLVILNGSSYPDSTNGKIIVFDEKTGSIKINLSSLASKEIIPSQKRLYDIKVKVGDEVKLISRGKIDLLPDITNSI